MSVPSLLTIIVLDVSVNVIIEYIALNITGKYIFNVAILSMIISNAGFLLNQV